MSKHATSTRLRAADLWLIGGLLVVAAVAFLALRLGAARGTYIEVTVDGASVARLPLAADTTRVIAGVGGENTLVIAGGKASVTAADCPDGVCVRHRAVSRAGESILCLPHKLAVRVVGGEPGVDAEVGL